MLDFDRFKTVDMGDEPIAVIKVSPSALDFIVDNLPPADGYTQDLEKLREAAKQELWDREAGR